MLMFPPPPRSQHNVMLVNILAHRSKIQHRPLTIIARGTPLYSYREVHMCVEDSTSQTSTEKTCVGV